MTASPNTAEVGPSLAEQVSRLYDLIAGYHLTNLIEVAREVGVWERIAAQPGITSASLADALGTDAHYTDVLCRTAFAFELLEREGDGWRMAAHMDTILGDPASTFYLGRAAKVHLTLGGEDYPDLADRLRRGRVVPYQDHSDALHRRGRRQPQIAAPDVRRPGAASPPGPGRPTGRRRAGARPGMRGRMGDRRARAALSDKPRRRRGHRTAVRRACPGADRPTRPDRTLLGAAAGSGGPDRRRPLRRHHDVPRGPRDPARAEGSGSRLGRPSAGTRRIARHLRRGVPRNRRSPCARCPAASRRSRSGSS